MRLSLFEMKYLVSRFSLNKLNKLQMKRGTSLGILYFKTSVFDELFIYKHCLVPSIMLIFLGPVYMGKNTSVARPGAEM